MRAPVYIVCAALMAAVNSEENYYGPQGVEPLGYGDEQEALGFLLPRLMAKYRANRQWGGVAFAPYYPAVDDIDTSNIDNQLTYSEEGRSKRAGLMNSPSLSISNSLDVLRNRLILEMSRKKEAQEMKNNRDVLCMIGKRSPYDGKRKCKGAGEKFVDDKIN